MTLRSGRARDDHAPRRPCLSVERGGKTRIPSAVFGHPVNDVHEQPRAIDVPAMDIRHGEERSRCSAESYDRWPRNCNAARRGKRKSPAKARGNYFSAFRKRNRNAPLVCEPNYFDKTVRDGSTIA